jgi:hypothetical protein
VNFSQKLLDIVRLVLIACCCLFISAGAPGQTSVTTYHYDNARTGTNPNETTLTPTNVNANTFGKLFSLPVDGWVYAQPLYMPRVVMGAGTPQAGTMHNVLFVATEHDSLYALDADNNTGANANPLWKASLIDTAHGAGTGEKPVPNGDVSTGDLVPEIGIVSTPVVDPATNTIYVVAKSTVADTTFIQRLHALDITTGKEKFAGPVVLSGTVPGTGNGSSGGTLNWDPKWQMNRASLMLLNGIVYIGFGSHGDNGPWHGWILAYNASTLNETGVWCSSPNSIGSGIWGGGAGFAADVPAGKPYGRIFAATGNGTYDAVAPTYANSMDYGDSILKLDLANGVPTMNSNGTVVGDVFTPHAQASLNNADEDQGSGGVVILPDSVGGGNGQHQLAQVGKSAIIYVLNRENLGGYTPANTKDPQEAAYLNGGLWGAPAYWNGKIFVWGINDHLKSFSFANGMLSANPTSTSAELIEGYYSPTPTVSANGTSNGIVWSVKTNNYTSEGQETLYAHDATNVANLLYSSDQNSMRDNPGNSVKFITPMVANGKVYLGSESQVSVFGLLGGSVQATVPVISPAPQSFSSSLQVSITDSTTGATIFYTTDGTTPTTASSQYTAPFTISSTTTVNAIAAGTGILASPVASATYTLTTQVAAPTYNPPAGMYSTVQSVVITTTTPNSTIYYTTDGTTPTTASLRYTGAVTVSATETLDAIAVASGLSNSPVASGLYTIDTGVSLVNFTSGFTAGSMTLLGSATLNGTALRLTDGRADEVAAAWYPVPANVGAFTTDFTFLITPATNAIADGLAFVIQENNTTAIGPYGGGLGYGPDTTTGVQGIANSVAVKFDLSSNSGEGSDSTGLYTNGASPTIPSVDMTGSGVDLHSGHPFHVHMNYDGTTLGMTITDTTTNGFFAHSWPIDIPGTVGDAVAYVGFTGGTGGLTSTQDIQSWTYNSANNIVATPVFSPAAGTYLGTQMVTISDATAGASILYTLDGTTPNTVAGGSTLAYTAPITVTATEMINAIAIALNYSPSAVASAKFTIESKVATPTFSPAGGTFPTAQTVTISTTSPGATIYYSTDGTTPTTASTQYTAPITVSTTQTIMAIAVASGFLNSNVSSAIFTIGASVTTINLGSGFSTGSMILNGNAVLNGTRLRLTDGGSAELASAWYYTPVNIQQFVTNFSFQITGGPTSTADGFMFVIQGGPSTAIGQAGGGLGYGPDSVGGTPGIGQSVAIKFDLSSNAGEGSDSTGLYTNGASPTIPSVDMTNSGVNLHTTDVFNVQISYDSANLKMTITDATTNATFNQTWQINIPATVGANAAYVGFTGGTGDLTAIQEIIAWTMSASQAAAATPTFSPATGTYTMAQTVTISDATSGATIYYTTDGTTPTTASTQYTTPITVSTTQTIKAIAVASGYTQSAVGSASYTITLPAAATPTFSPAAGTYTTAQTVTISDATSGATIYYTTNGTTPTISSTKYAGAITVSTTQTIKAIAVASGYTQSAVGSASYTITLPAAATPTFSLAAGTYTTAQTVTISDATSGATIYYTTDGTTPTTASTQYTTPITVSTTQTIKAIAVASGYTQSAVGSASYTITLPAAATPTFSLAAGTYTTAQTVTISDTTSGATIYYTTNGTTPTISSTKYTGAITVSTTQTVQAIAVAPGFSTSSVGRAKYTIKLHGK